MVDTLPLVPRQRWFRSHNHLRTRSVTPAFVAWPLRYACVSPYTLVFRRWKYGNC